MALFEGLLSNYVLDAEGRPRRLYPLGAWWRSPRVRGDVPREVYEAICAEALRRGGERRSDSWASPLAPAESAWVRWASRIMMFGMLLFLLRRQLLRGTSGLSWGRSSRRSLSSGCSSWHRRPHGWEGFAGGWRGRC